MALARAKEAAEGGLGTALYLHALMLLQGGGYRENLAQGMKLLKEAELRSCKAAGSLKTFIEWVDDKICHSWLDVPNVEFLIEEAIAVEMYIARGETGAEMRQRIEDLKEKYRREMQRAEKKKPAAKPEETPKTKPEVKPAAKPEETPTAKPEEKPTIKPEEKPAAKTEAAPEVPAREEWLPDAGKLLDEANAYLEKGEKSLAAERLLRAAELGNPEAQYLYAQMLFDGDGIVMNRAEAVKYYRRAAEQDHVQAQYALGVCCLDGKGVAKEASEAAIWLERAAQHGIADAQYLLYTLLSGENGAAADRDRANMWLRKAAAQDHEIAKSILEEEKPILTRIWNRLTGR